MLQGFAAAYYQCDPRSAGFLSPRYRFAHEWPKVLDEARERTIAPELLQEIEAQSRALGPSSERERQLERLATHGATVVVTGQQLGLFLGPLYTLYKALTAVEWAQKLEAESGRPVVPLFWLQTEDHDFDEIAHYRTVDSNGDPLEIHLPLEPNRRSVAHLRLDDAILPALESLEHSVRWLPEGEREVERYRLRYRPGASWVDAFTRVLADYFAAEGLLFLNPRCETVARLVAPLHERAVRESEGIGRDLARRAEALQTEGFRVQVSIRPECSLSFFHPDGAEGERFRLQPVGRSFELAGRSGTVSSAELTRALEQEPLRFSSSALLRPIIQDSLLPTVAYVGGPGEISYFSELQPLYDRFDVAMPLVVPRRHFTVIEPTVRRALDHLGLDPEALSQSDLDSVARDRMAVDPRELRERLHAALERELGAVEPELLAIDPQIARPLRQTRDTIGFALDKFAGRVEDAQRRSDETLANRLDTVRNHLFPGGAPQERVHGGCRLFARFGVEGFKRSLSGAPEGEPGRAVVVEPPPIPTGGAL